MRKLSLALILMLGFSSLGSAVSNAQPIDPAYFTVGEPESSITEISEDAEEVNESIALSKLSNQTGHLGFLNKTIEAPIIPFGEGGGALEIIDIAFKVWDIIQKGKPVANVSGKFASALPAISQGDWRMLTGWKPVRSFKVSVFYKNLYKIKVVELTYKVSLHYGGSVNGAGEYINLAQVQPTEVNVLWGYNLDVRVEVPEIYNAGTNESPIAAIRMDVNWRVQTVVKSMSKSESYLFQGDGLMRNTNTGNFIFRSASDILSKPN